MTVSTSKLSQTKKKDLAFLYNRVNQEIYGTGVKKTAY